jgi:peptide/nickel transport system ATP-binding protein/oligopeptide transport system ATP-binding protein
MTGDPAPILRVENLVKNYRLRRADGSYRQIRAVDGVSLDLHAGETVAIVGESGCGKSTLAKLVMQLERPDAGTIAYDGHPVSSASRADELGFRRAVQMVFQDPYGSLTPHFRVGTLIGEPLRIHRLATGAELRARVADLLASVGLDADLAQRFPHELSGGQRQRVSIARAIATGPRIVVCDEPVSALDVSVRSQIMNLLLHLQRDLGLSYLFISHDLGLVDHVSDHVCVMYLGRIVEQASARQFFAAPRHPYSRALIASTPRPEPEHRNRPAPITGEVGEGEPATGCGFRNRCPFATDICAREQPALLPAASGHLVACHRVDEIAA